MVSPQRPRNFSRIRSPTHLPLGSKVSERVENVIARLQFVTESSSPETDIPSAASVTYPASVLPRSFVAPFYTSASEVQKKSEDISVNWAGKGAHVDFLPNDKVPLQQGRFLGHGSMGSVYEATFQERRFAWKRRFCRRGIGEAERKEIEILKKVSHKHIIRLAGSYTHRQFLGLLLHPVAICDLATFFEDYESIVDDRVKPDPTRQERLSGLGLLPFQPDFHYSASNFLYSRMGCITCAVQYLHGQKIRHKDLKPSNILLSAHGLWLADFGTATDFSLQTLSMTENNERGTPKYFAPEVAAYQLSGRAADIFSLGCVFLEMHVLAQGDTLDVLRHLRSAQDKSFQANLDPILFWLQKSEYSEELASQCDGYLKMAIANMLAREPTERPKIAEIRSTLDLLDALQQRNKAEALFGTCCRTSFISNEELQEQMLKMSYLHQVQIEQLETAHSEEVRSMEAKMVALKSSVEDEKAMARRYHKEAKMLRKQVAVFISNHEGNRLEQVPGSNMTHAQDARKNKNAESSTANASTASKDQNKQEIPDVPAVTTQEGPPNKSSQAINGPETTGARSANLHESVTSPLKQVSALVRSMTEPNSKPSSKTVQGNGLQRHACDQCDFVFTFKESLKDHIKRRHGEHSSTRREPSSTNKRFALIQDSPWNLPDDEQFF